MGTPKRKDSIQKGFEPVTVVGGGLAGLVTALKLVERGIPVDLFESSDHLGGKAASLTNNLIFDGNFEEIDDGFIKKFPSDHGYHVFPKWYYNMRNLWVEIGLDLEKEVYESGDYYRLEAGGDYTFHKPKDWSFLKKLCVLDLMTQRDEEVDDITCRGFFYSRKYNLNDSITLDNLFLNALSIAEYDIGARAVRDLFRQWQPVIKESNWDLLKGDLSSVLIDKIEAKAKEYASTHNINFNIKLNHSLTEISVQNNKPKIKIEEPNGQSFTIENSPIVMAIPMEVLRSMQNEELFKSESNIGDLNYLRANQFSALDIYFKEKLKNMPPDHFDLEGSKYYISAIDVSEIWPNLKDNPNITGSVLQFVAGDCKPLKYLPTQSLMKALVKEIEKFIPDATPQGIKYIFAHDNIELPLFINDVGTWSKRPKSKGDLFYFAGDYTRHPVDITSMEGAVLSGLLAAEEVRKDSYPNTEKVPTNSMKVISKEELDELRIHINTIMMAYTKISNHLSPQA